MYEIKYKVPENTFRNNNISNAKTYKNNVKIIDPNAVNGSIKIECSYTKDNSIIHKHYSISRQNIRQILDKLAKKGFLIIDYVDNEEIQNIDKSNHDENTKIARYDFMGRQAYNNSFIQKYN